MKNRLITLSTKLCVVKGWIQRMSVKLVVPTFGGESSDVSRSSSWNRRKQSIVLIAVFPFSGGEWHALNLATRAKISRLVSGYENFPTRIALPAISGFHFGTREEELRWSSAATRDRVTIEWTSKTWMHVPLSARRCHETRAWWLIFGSRSIPASWHVQYSC